jgi:S-methylmethionine-dependent homocysteine/selenocysteine methylase
MEAKLMSDKFHSRRSFLQGIALSAAFLPLVRAGDVLAAEALPHLAESDPVARALAYTENAASLSPAKDPVFKQGSTCANCAQYVSAQEQKGYAPCNAFPGKSVNAKGWCRAWAVKP